MGMKLVPVAALLAAVALAGPAFAEPPAVPVLGG